MQIQYLRWGVCTSVLYTVEKSRTTHCTGHCKLLLVLVFLVSTLGEEGNCTVRWVATEATVDHKRLTYNVMRNGRSPKKQSALSTRSSSSCFHSKQQTRWTVRPFVSFVRWNERHHTLRRRKLTLATVTWQRTLFIGSDRQICNLHAFCVLQHKISTILPRC